MKFFVLLLPLVLLCSCSIQKRKYQSGYYVNWHNKEAKVKSQNAVVASSLSNDKAGKPAGQNQDNNRSTLQNDALVASVTSLEMMPELKKTPVFLKAPADSCDILVYNDGSEIQARVKEISSSEIKYKRCDAPDGPIYISKTSELFMIKYANGTREVIKHEAPVRQPSSYTQKPGNYPLPPGKSYRQIHPLAWVALLFGALSVFIALAIVSTFVPFNAGTAIFIVPFILAIVAVLTGKTALNRIREHPEIYKGKGLAVPGFVMGTVILGIYLTIFLFLTLLFGI